jgi:hypothetical protein
VLAGEQAPVGEGRVAGLEDLEAQAEDGSIPPRQVRADERPWCARAEHRAVADVAVQGVGAAEGVVGLGQAPDVVVADRLGVSGPDANLVVEGPARVVPHSQEPVGPELRLGGEVRRGRAGTHLGGEVAHSREQQRGGVAQGLLALDVVAGVPPSSGGVDPDPQRGEVAGEAARRVHVGGEVGHRVLVVEVAGRGPQRRGDEVRPVTLGLVEGQRVRQRAAVHARAGVDPEARGGGDRPGHRDRIGPCGAHLVEVQRVDVRIGRAPRAEPCADGTGEHHGAGRVPDDEGGACFGRARHQVGALGRAQRVTDLVHSDKGGGGSRSRPRTSGEVDEQQGKRYQERDRATPGRRDPNLVRRSHRCGLLGPEPRGSQTRSDLSVKFPN